MGRWVPTTPFDSGISPPTDKICFKPHVLNNYAHMSEYGARTGARRGSMPGRDGTGPQGKGPITGRGMGNQQGAKKRKRGGTVPQQEPQKSNEEK